MKILVLSASSLDDTGDGTDALGGGAECPIPMVDRAPGEAGHPGLLTDPDYHGPGNTS